MAQANQDSLNKLKSMHEEVNRKIEEFKLSQRQKFLRKLYPLIKKWKGPLPNLKDIFTKEEIDWLLSESVKSTDRKIEPSALIDFVIRTGYRDEPDLGKDGKPISRRTTPIHHAVYQHYECVPELFKIYDRFDVNYIDEECSDYSHFHIVCDSGYDDIALKFLDAGQDPDCLLARGSYESFDDPPLYSAMRLSHTEVLQLLLRRGADPNIANVDGRTPLHATCNTRELEGGKYWAEMLFEICDEVQRTVQLDPRDKKGKTPLHLAVANRYEDMIEFLLRRGADPNAADAEGLTPLHVICNDHSDKSGLAVMLFEICDDVQKTVQIDARDKLGRTPLQSAVANCQPNVLDVLLDRGADLSSFVFPTDDHFVELSISDNYFVNSSRLKLASGALTVVERLEKRGYELKRSDALTIMNTIAKYGLFEISTEPGTLWCEDHNDEEEFEMRAKELMMNASLSLYDVTRLRPEKAEKLLTYTDFTKFARTSECWSLSILRSHRPCYAHLSEILLGGFFRRWALDPVLELTRYQLPILCCDTIIKQLSNKDLHHICLAAAGQSSRG